MFNESVAGNDKGLRNSRRIVTVIALEGHSETSLLALAARVAVDLEPEAIANGVAASGDGRSVVVGDAAFLTKLGISIAPLRDWPDRMRQQGQQVVFVAVDGRAAGFFGVVESSA